MTVSTAASHVYTEIYNAGFALSNAVTMASNNARINKSALANRLDLLQESMEEYTNTDSYEFNQDALKMLASAGGIIYTLYSHPADFMDLASYAALVPNYLSTLYAFGDYINEKYIKRTTPTLCVLEGDSRTYTLLKAKLPGNLAMLGMTAFVFTASSFQVPLFDVANNRIATITIQNYPKLQWQTLSLSGGKVMCTDNSDKWDDRNWQQ